MSEIDRAVAPAQPRTPKAPQGSFVPLYRSLVHKESRWRTVGPHAELAFVVLKLAMQCENIGRSMSWAGEIADRCSLTEEEATVALRELRDAGIIEWQGRTLWIVQGLANDPSMRGNVSPAFVKGLANRVANLEDCPVKRRFLTHYASVFGETSPQNPGTPLGETSPRDLPGRSPLQLQIAVGSEGKKGTKSGKTQKPARKPRTAKAPASAPAPTGDWAKRMAAAAYLNGFDVSEDRLERDFRTLVSRHGGDRVVAVWQHYLDNTTANFYGVLSFRERFQILADQLDGKAAPRQAKPAQQRSESEGPATVSPAEYMRQMAAGAALMGGTAND